MDRLEHRCIHSTNGVTKISHMMPHDGIFNNLTKFSHYDYTCRYTLLLWLKSINGSTPTVELM
jgi:hypothetical protein